MINNMYISVCKHICICLPLKTVDFRHKQVPKDKKHLYILGKQALILCTLLFIRWIYLYLKVFDILTMILVKNVIKSLSKKI